MEQLPPFGKAIMGIVRPTQQVYEPLLQQNAAKIKSTPRKTFSYGDDPRQNLDVYYPSQNPSGDGCPILIFLYGGGLVRGDRRLSVVGNDLVYANLGHFFAENGGFIVVIPDYRLVPQARYPSGGEDLAQTLEWILSNTHEFGASGQQRDLYLMGNSAGGVHVSTYLLAPAFSDFRKHILGQSSESFMRLKRAILIQVPLHFETADSSRSQVLEAYYGDKIDEHCPLGLLKSLKVQSSVQDVLPSVDFLLLVGTLDPEEIIIPNNDFVEAWSLGCTGPEQEFDLEFMNGHNHLSPPLALGTRREKDEEWGHRVIRFCSSPIER